MSDFRQENLMYVFLFVAGRKDLKDQIEKERRSNNRILQLRQPVFFKLISRQYHFLRS